MKVAVLGIDEVAIVAVDAIRSHQHEPVLVMPSDATIQPPVSPLNELTFSYPGVQEDVIKFHIQGDRDWSLAHQELAKAGLRAFEGIKPQTSNERIINKILPETLAPLMWDLENITLGDLLLRETGSYADALINTIDKNRFCDVDDHQMIRTALWWSVTKGPKLSPGHVVYNVDPDVGWAITSNIDGRQVTIWDQQPPFDDVHLYTLPTRTTCTCETPGIGLHVGREATYRPTTLAECYEQVVEFLYNPLSKIDIEDADTEPQRRIDDTLTDMEPIDISPGFAMEVEED